MGRTMAPHSTLLTIRRSEIVRMVGIAHSQWEWEVAEFVTRMAMLFGPAQQGQTEDDAICLDKLTMHNDWMWERVKLVQLDALI